MTPEISICVTTSGRFPLLKGCLASIVQQYFPKDQLEVLIPIESQLMDLAQAHCGHFDLPITFLPMENLNSSTSRNMGIRKAQGKILYFVDDDCAFVNPQHLKNLVAYHQRHPDITVIGGRYTDGDTSSTWGKAYNLVCNCWQDRHLQDPSVNTPAGFVGGNLSIKLNRFSREVRFGDVVEFGAEEIHYIHDMHLRGLKSLLVNGLTIYHHAQHDMRTFFSRAWIQGKNKCHSNDENVMHVFKDRRYLLNHRSQLASKSLATLYIGCAQLSWFTNSSYQKWQQKPLKELNSQSQPNS